MKNEIKPGRHTDGDGLRLHTRPSGRKARVFRHVRDGRLRDMGLGGYPDVRLTQAREALQKHRDVSRAGIDPIEAEPDPARAMHGREGENPVRWTGRLATVLPKPGKVCAVEHHPSLP